MKQPNQIYPETSNIIYLQVRDAQTLRVKRERYEKNIITVNGFDAIINRVGGRFTDPSQFTDADKIYATEAKRLRTPVGPESVAPNDGSLTNSTVADSRTQEAVLIDGNPPYLEFAWRFNAPPAQRNWNTFYLDARHNFSHIPLSSPCTQASDEVLDVTYRIQYIPQGDPSTLQDVGVDPKYGFGILDGYFRGNDNLTVGDVFRLHTGKFSTDKYNTFPKPGNGQSNINKNTDNFVSSLSEQPPFNLTGRSGYKRRISLDIAEGDSNLNGKVFSTVLYCTSGGQSDFEGDPALALTWAPLVPKDFPNKPVQPIHNHNKDAIEPFLDADFLASSAGSLSVDGSSWTDPDWPRFFRIDHINSGDVGASTYTYRKRATLSFDPSAADGISYKPSTEESTMLKFARVDSNNNPLRSTVKGVSPNEDHGLSTDEFIESYDTETFMFWDSTGLIIQQQFSGGVNVFDANTTPALNVSGIGQAARDVPGSVYVADRASGLYRIDNPLGSPSVTKFSSSSNGIPSGGDNACYGVVQGYSGRMWALFEGGLSYTDDNGSTWTNLDPNSTPSFTHTGITDGNWGTVTYIQADRQAPTHEIALIRDTQDGTNNPYEVVWYSLDTGSATAYTNRKFEGRYNSVRCSLTGSIWLALRSSVDSYILRFGSTSTETQLSTGDITFGVNLKASAFLYDYYNSPLPMIVDNNNRDRPAIAQADGEQIGPLDRGFSLMTTFEEQSPGFFTYSRGTDSPLGILSGFRVGNGLLTEGSALALNYRYTPLEGTVWKRFHWNGTSWEQNYYADAQDSATFGPYPAPRENFDVESHFFTGRSLINGTPAFASGNFGNPADATWAVTLTPSAKLNTSSTETDSKDQEPERTVFEVADPSVTNRVSVQWDDGSGNIAVVEDIGSNSTVNHTITTTPSDGSSYRFVAVLSGTNLSLYIDGSQIGTTISLATGLDLSNSSNELVYYVGARAFLWNWQRHSTLPGNFYRGNMGNIQTWTGAWSSTDISNDASNPSGVISSSNATLVARWELTEDLTGTESKTTHSTNESLDEGLTIGFNTSTDGTDFIATDYHTFAVVDGILKDNATAFSQNFSMYQRPVQIDFNTFTNPSGTSTIPSSSTTGVTEVASTIRESNTGSGVIPFPGTTGKEDGGDNGTGSARAAFTVQKITGDGYYEGTPAGDFTKGGLGLSTSPGSEDLSDIEFGFQFRQDGNVDIVESGTTTVSAATTYDINTDVFRVTRSSNAIEYIKFTNGTPSTVHTSSQTSSSTLYGITHHADQATAFVGLTIQYTQPAYSMRVGSSSNNDGAFDPDFLRIETEELNTISIQLDGTEADIVSGNDTWWNNMPSPAQGQVVVNGASGHLLFNSNDAGKTVTGTVTVVYLSL